MTNASEKRRFNRFGFQQKIQAFPVVPSQSGNIYEVRNESLELHAYDISEGGLRLRSSRTFDSDTILKLHIFLSEEEFIEVYGKVIWTHKDQHGVRFVLTDQGVRKGLRVLARNISFLN